MGQHRRLQGSARARRPKSNEAPVSQDPAKARPRLRCPFTAANCAEPTTPRHCSDRLDGVRTASARLSRRSRYPTPSRTAQVVANELSSSSTVTLLSRSCHRWPWTVPVLEADEPAMTTIPRTPSYRQDTRSSLQPRLSGRKTESKEGKLDRPWRCGGLWSKLIL